MTFFVFLRKIILMVAVLCCADIASGQAPKNNSVKPIISTNTDSTAEPEKNIPSGGDKKILPTATINLQTTVTGNQEQPRVLYILPWQTPVTDAVDFESFDNQQKAVFEHVEREELRRELDSVSE